MPEWKLNIIKDKGKTIFEWSSGENVITLPGGSSSPATTPETLSQEDLAVLKKVPRNKKK